MLYAIVLNTNTCLIFQYQKRTAQLSFVNSIEHPENKLKISESLGSDRRGHYNTDNAARGTFSPRTDPKEVEYTQFVREVAKILNEARMQHEYEHLVIIAAPYVHGLLLQHLDKNVKALIIKNIKKDIVQFDHKKINDFLKSELQFVSS